MPTVSSVFNICFNDSFQDYGFKRIKGTNIFARLINNEIFQYITYKHLPYRLKGYKEFAVYAGVLTVYSESLHKENLLHWGEYVAVYSKLFNTKEVEENYSYRYNEDSMVQVVSSCVAKAEKVLMPILENITDLDQYIEYRKEIRIDILSGADRLRNDSIVLVKANNRDDFMGLFNELVQREKEQIDKGRRGGTYEELYALYYDGIIKYIAEARDNVYNDSNLYEEVQNELERRRVNNMEMLKQYGLWIIGRT